MYNCLKFDLGRNALKYLVKEYKIMEINIPYYLCSVIRHTLFKENCKINFYHIDDNFMPSVKFNKYEYVLYPNYFGVFRKNVEKLAKIYPNLIVDCAHAYYDEPIGFASFNAGHKFGYNDSLLWIKDTGIIKPIKIIINEYDKDLRNKNFFKFFKKYQSSNLLKLDIHVDSSPFVYPYLASSEEEADELVKTLIKEGNIIYRYWNQLPKIFNEYKFYSRLVPIPCS